MKCERCGVETKGYDLHDYCEVCGKNLCTKCMSEGTCKDGSNKKHQPSQENVE